MLEIAVFGSGKGSNFQAILQAIRDGKIPGAGIRVVLSNNSSAGILEIARANGIPFVHLSQRQCINDDEFENRLLNVLQNHAANFIALAGYMKQVPRRIVEAYKGRIVNIHPALLPRHGGKGMFGMRVHEAVIAAGESITGATVHFVEEEYDRGDILLQRTVAVASDDTPETLAAKVLKIEHEIYPEALRLIAEGNAVRNARASVDHYS